MTFNDRFFSLSMHQLFNRSGAVLPLNDNEAPLRRYLRFAGRL